MGKIEKVAEFRRRRKANLNLMCGNKCQICGQNKAITALEFHHIKAKDKSYSLSSGNCHSIEQDIAETEKCILVCANCHREIHEGFYDEEFLWQHQFIDSAIKTQLLEKGYGKKYYCSECGKEITASSSSGKCASCVQKEHRKVPEELRPSRERLKEMIRSKSFSEIGREYGITDNAIRKWCKKMDLPHTKKEIDSISDEDWKSI